MKAQAEQREAEKAVRDAQRQVEKLQDDLAALDRKMVDAIEAVIASQNDNDRAFAKSKLEQLRKEKVELEGRLLGAKRGATRSQAPAPTEEDKLREDIATLDTKIRAAVDAVVVAQNDQDREAAKLEQIKLGAERNKLLERLNVVRRADRIRRRANQTPDECLENPLAKGC